VVAALKRARLVLLGPGNPTINVASVLLAPGVRAALLATRGERLWVGTEAGQASLAAWLGEPTPMAAPARWQAEVQTQLLRQAAGHAKSQAG
jgi:2-phospho-L-lactate transferase/gluconeogenesis factor (CofD/UPF0052 family)